MERKDGYYWVCFNETKDWCICEWFKGSWVDEINEKAIFERSCTNGIFENPQMKIQFILVYIPKITHKLM